MSRATVLAEGTRRTRPRLLRLVSLSLSVFLYSLYPVVVCVAIARGHPRMALAATCIALGVFLVTLRHWRRFGIVLLVIAPIVLLSEATTIAQPLVFAPPVVLNLVLAFLCARSLRRGREPLISTFARLERGSLETDLARYTRMLTRVWLGFFVGSAALSALLAVTAPPAVWGWFVAVGNQLAVVLLFVGEYCFRRVRFPQYRHASPLALAMIVARRWRPAIGQ
jgi:uncharacterized membrane protein